MTRFTLTAASIIALSAGAAFAASEMDTDGDGLVSFTEILVAVPSLTEETFTSIDANGDGALDDEEMAAAQESGVIPAG